MNSYRFSVSDIPSYAMRNNKTPLLHSRLCTPVPLSERRISSIDSVFERDISNATRVSQRARIALSLSLSSSFSPYTGYPVIRVHCLHSVIRYETLESKGPVSQFLPNTLIKVVIIKSCLTNWHSFLNERSFASRGIRLKGGAN